MATGFKAIVLLALVLMLIPAIDATIQNASIINKDTGALSNMSFSATAQAYIDLAEGNPDVTLQVCSDNVAGDLSGKYGGFAYTINGTPFKVLAVDSISGNNTGIFTCGATCCNVSGTLDFNSNYAAYPAQVYGVVSSDAIIDSSDTFVKIGQSSWLRGDYSFNYPPLYFSDLKPLHLGYTPSDGKLNVTVSAILGNTQSGTAYSIRSIAYLVVGVCQPISGLLGYSCNSTNVTSPSVQNRLDTGITSPSDTITTTKYMVVNGLPYSFCIGPDLNLTNITVNPVSAHQAQNVTVNVTFQNSNNVDVTTDFNIGLFRNGTFFGYAPVTATVGRNQNVSAIGIFDTTGMASGLYNITASVNGSGIGDCDTSNNNISTNLTLEKTYNITVYINGSQTIIFPVPGRPYNVTVIADDSDGNDAANITVRITERNGLNLFAPSQGFDVSGEKRGVVSLSAGQALTNNSGVAELALAPLGSKLFLPEYSYLNASDYIGNYSIYVELFDRNGAEKLQLYYPSTDSLIDQFNLSLTNQTALDPTTAEEHSITPVNYNKWFTTVIQFMVQAWGSVQKWTNLTAP